ncbi:MAG: acyltransferase [Chthoniobacteraceae bacterium]|nr:acyltransferase [Chthoniobacteraceae bacterium]
MHPNNNFQIIRFILATLVLFSHSYQLIDGDARREPLAKWCGFTLGHVAVCGFFILSGFLIAKSWDRQPHFGDFIVRRVARIYPGFVICGIVCVFVVGPLGALDASSYFQTCEFGSLSQMLVLRWPRTPPAFLGWPYPSLNGSVWSIPYEFRCYVLVALLGIFGAFKRKAWLAGFILCACIASCFVIPNFRPKSFLFVVFGEPDVLVTMGTVFLAGVGFYVFRNLIAYRMSYVFIAATCLFVGVALLPSNPELPLAIAGGYLLLGFAHLNLASLRVINLLPDFSYGLYLYGWPLQKISLWMYPSLQPVALFFLVVGPASLLGLLSWFCVEKHFLRKARAATNNDKRVRFESATANRAS